MRCGRRIRGFAALAVAIAAPSAALADKTWNNAVISGGWNTGGNWVEQAVPTVADNVFIVASDAIDRSVTLDVSSTMRHLQISNSGSGSFILDHSGTFSLATESETVGGGIGGHGVHIHSAGINTTSWLRIAEGQNSTGAYFLSGSATLTVSGAFEESLGDAGLGSFVQTGGTNRTDYFSMGASGGVGSYVLSAGAWQVVHEEYLYNGSVVHAGGTHTVDNLYVGAGGGFGSYHLSASGILNVSGDENVSSEGGFIQTGGTHTVGSTLTLADYTLSGTGALDVSISTDMFSFTQTGGVHTTAALTVVNEYKLSGASTLHVTGDENLGIIPDTTGTFSHNGGAHNVDGTLFIGTAGGARGSYAISAGELKAATTEISAGSTLTQTGGTVEAGALTITGGGRLTVAPDGGRTLRLQTVSIDAVSTLDLNDNDIVIQSASFTAIRDLVFGGYSAAPDSTKTGIISSASQALGGTTLLILFDNALAGAADWPPGSGNSLASTAVVGKYTYIGDADLDGQVTPADYTAIDSNLGLVGLDPGISWLYGDLDFDGNVTPADYTAIDASLGLGIGNPLGAVAVPEGGTVGAVIGVGVLLCRRRTQG